MHPHVSGWYQDPESRLGGTVKENRASIQRSKSTSWLDNGSRIPVLFRHTANIFNHVRMPQQNDTSTTSSCTDSQLDRSASGAEYLRCSSASDVPLLCSLSTERTIRSNRNGNITHTSHHRAYFLRRRIQEEGNLKYRAESVSQRKSITHRNLFFQARTACLQECEENNFRNRRLDTVDSQFGNRQIAFRRDTSRGTISPPLSTLNLTATFSAQHSRLSQTTKALLGDHVNQLTIRGSKCPRGFPLAMALIFFAVSAWLPVKGNFGTIRVAFDLSSDRNRSNAEY